MKRIISLLLILSLLCAPLAAPAENWWERFKEGASSFWEDVTEWTSEGLEEAEKAIEEWWPLITAAGREGWQWICDEATVVGAFGAEKWAQLKDWLQDYTEERLCGIVADLLMQLGVPQADTETVTAALQDYAAAHEITYRKVLCLSLPYLVHQINSREKNGDAAGMTAQEAVTGLTAYFEAAGVVNDDAATTALDGLKTTVEELFPTE